MVLFLLMHVKRSVFFNNKMNLYQPDHIIESFEDMHALLFLFKMRYVMIYDF